MFTAFVGIILSIGSAVLYGKERKSSPTNGASMGESELTSQPTEDEIKKHY